MCDDMDNVMVMTNGEIIFVSGKSIAGVIKAVTDNLLEDNITTKLRLEIDGESSIVATHVNTQLVEHYKKMLGNQMCDYKLSEQIRLAFNSEGQLVTTDDENGTICSSLRQDTKRHRLICDTICQEICVSSSLDTLMQDTIHSCHKAADIMHVDVPIHYTYTVMYAHM